MWQVTKSKQNCIENLSNTHNNIIYIAISVYVHYYYYYSDKYWTWIKGSMIQCHEDFVLHKSHFLFNLSSAYLGEHSNRIFSYLFQDVDGLKRVNLSCWAKEKRKKLLIIETLAFILQYWILDDETATVKSKFNFLFCFSRPWRYFFIPILRFNNYSLEIST